MGLFSKNKKNKKRENVIITEEELQQKEDQSLEFESENDENDNTEKNLDKLIEIYDDFSDEKKMEYCVNALQPFIEKYNAKVKKNIEDGDLIITFRIRNYPIKLTIDTEYDQTSEFLLKFDNKFGWLRIYYDEDELSDNYINNNSGEIDEAFADEDEQRIFIDKHTYFEEYKKELFQVKDTFDKIPENLRIKLIDFIRNEKIGYVKIYEDEIGFDLEETSIVLKGETEIYDRVIDIMTELADQFSQGENSIEKAPTVFIEGIAQNQSKTVVCPHCNKSFEV